MKKNIAVIAVALSLLAGAAALATKSSHVSGHRLAGNSWDAQVIQPDGNSWD